MRGTADANAERAALARLVATCAALARQNGTLTRLVALYDRLTALVVQGGTLETLSRQFARLVGCSVTVLDPLLQPLAAAAPGATEGAEGTLPAPLPWPPDDPQWRQVLATLREEQRPLRVPALDPAGAGAWVLAPIAVGGDCLGYLAVAEAVSDDGAESLALLAAQHTAAVYALVLLRERHAVELARRLRAELLEALLLAPSADPDTVRARARGLGLALDAPYAVLVLAPAAAAEPGEAGGVAPHLRCLLDALADRAAHGAPDVAVARRDELVVLVPEPARTGRRPLRERSAPSRAHTLAERLVAVAARLSPATRVVGGIGGPARAPSELARAYRQAQRALAAARRFEQVGPVVAFAELGVYRLLHQVEDAAELAEFADSVLGALVRYDETHGAEFVRTLAVYLQHHGSLQHTARALCVHVNTVGYRLQRIQTITGLDLATADDRLSAQLALKILENGGVQG